MSVDVLDILAIILGVLFTIRKLDAQRRLPSEFPEIDAAAFLRWRAREVSVFGAAMIASFAKFLADLGFQYFFAPQIDVRSVRMIAGTIDVSWILVMVVTYFRTRGLAKQRRALGIVLGGFIVESGSELSTELKAALRFLEAGDHDRAIYELRQITLDSDGSLRAIALYWLGEGFLRKGDGDAARDAFLESLEVDSTLLQPREALSRLDKARD